MQGAFDLLMYTNRDLEVPEMWEESGPQIIANSQEVRLRSFSTAIHKVDTMVSYKSEDWEKMDCSQTASWVYTSQMVDMLTCCNAAQRWSIFWAFNYGGTSGHYTHNATWNQWALILLLLHTSEGST